MRMRASTVVCGLSEGKMSQPEVDDVCSGSSVLCVCITSSSFCCSAMIDRVDLYRYRYRYLIDYLFRLYIDRL